VREHASIYASPPNAAPGGIQIDVAPLDVPASWGPAPSSARPRSAVRTTTNKDGSANGFDHLLANRPDHKG